MIFTPGHIFTDFQYIAWRVALGALAPPPSISPAAFAPPTWGSNPENYGDVVSSIITDPDGGLWVFDAVFELDHNQSQRITQHPVQTGANITDHSYSQPAILTMNIGMSDAMSSYIPSNWGSDTSTPTKSVQAYRKLVDWKTYGITLNKWTRLWEYQDMVISNINSKDNVETKYGMRCTAVFQQIFTSTVAAKNSLIPSVSGESASGSLNTIPAYQSNIPAVTNLPGN
jgi:hypothetical protein